MKIGNIIEFKVPGKKTTIHTGRVIKVNRMTVVVIDDKTNLKMRVQIVKTGCYYESEN